MSYVELSVVLIAGVCLAALIIWPAMRILRRAGLPPWLAVAAVVPVANIALLYFVALAPWPRSATKAVIPMEAEA